MTPVWDTYWAFAAERQRTFFRRLRNEQPYTQDTTLAIHRFTNAYRASDRVSQHLIQHVIYRGSQQPREVFFRTLLFRIFNKIETWELLEGAIGALTVASFRQDAYDRVLTEAMNDRRTIYSAAYIMPSRTKIYAARRKHRNHLAVLKLMLDERLPERLADVSTAADAFNLLKSYPMIGDFLGYQFFTDLNYGPLLSFSEMDFVVAGPGARGGIRKCFADRAGLSDADIIRLVADSQEVEFAKRGIEFPDLWGRKLQLIDCQNLFCEVDKYARVEHPEYNPKNGRSRIKQRYRPSRESLRVWYPPKWGINDRIPDECRARPLL